MIINFNKKNKEGKGRLGVLEDANVLLDTAVRKGLMENRLLTRNLLKKVRECIL